MSLQNSQDPPEKPYSSYSQNDPSPEDPSPPSHASSTSSGITTLFSAYQRIIYMAGIVQSSRTALIDFIVLLTVLSLIWIPGGIILGVLYNPEMPENPTTITQEQADRLQNMVFAPIILSILGSLCIVFAYFWFKRLRCFHLRLVLYLSISDLILDVSFLVVNISKETCAAQAGFSEYFPMCSCIWTLFIAYALYENLVQQRNVRDLVKFEWLMHVIAWGVPLLFSILVWSIEMGSQQLAWCWIDSAYASWRFLFFYLFLFLVFITNLIIYVMVLFYALRCFYQVRNISVPTTQQHLTREMAKLGFRFAWYLAAFFLTWIWGLSHRIFNLISPGNQVYFLVAAHTFFTPAQGFLNMLAYSASYRGHIIKWIKDKYGTKASRPRSQASGVGQSSQDASTSPRNNNDAHLSDVKLDSEYIEVDLNKE